MGFKLFSSYSEKQIKKIVPIVDKIESLADTFKTMSNEELRAYTDKLRGYLAEGKTLDDILPYAFALVREADERVLGKRPFRVQLMGGILLHQGRIAEMKTGEGKTLVATLPAYLNALTGKGVHIVTVNDYLARRDSEEMGRVYAFLGLTTGLVVHNQTREEKFAAYAADITYGTNNEFGFDYLRDNLVPSKEMLVQRGHSFAIVDEVDSILIDEARTPLIISGAGDESTDLYSKADKCARNFKRLVIKELDTKQDYDFDENYFDIDEETGLAKIKKSKLDVFKNTYGLSDSDVKLDEEYATAILTEGGKVKLCENGFADNAFATAKDGFVLTAAGYEKAESFLNRNFANEADSASCMTKLCMKKLMCFFGLKEEDFVYGSNKSSVAFASDALEKISGQLGFTEKDVEVSAGAALLKKSGMQKIGSALNIDYIVDEKGRTAVLTKQGIDKTEKYFGINNLSDAENTTIYHHINTAIRAHGVMMRDVDYIVKDGAVIIVDAFTGRLMPGRRYNDGLHQAIEAKENVIIQKENRTNATITFQNYFRMYNKLSGMTGTALTEDDEFRQIYALDVVEVPTNKPMIRLDRNDVVYRTRRGKMLAIIEQIKECVAKGQPVLVGTVSIEKSEELSLLLKRNGISHNVLNAKQHEREAEIVAQAGRFGAVTISTNMAGRGTDIMLGGNPEYLAKKDMRKQDIDEELIAAATGTADTNDEAILNAREIYRTLYEKHREQIKPEADRVREAGGLFILGTERHESRRIDNQLRGRSGRQGDPGESRFFLSLEDDLFRLFGASDRLSSMTARLGLDETTPIDFKILSNSIESAQKRMEARNFERRKHVLSYDDVMNQQRKIIYDQRSEVLFSDDISEKIEGMIVDSVASNFAECFASDSPSEWETEKFRAHYRGLLTDSRGFRYSENEDIDKQLILKELTEKALEIYRQKDEIFAKAGHPDGAMREYEKHILLNSVTKNWINHLENIDELKEYVGLNSYAQRNPITMYRIQSAELFEEMTETIKEDTVRGVLSVMPKKKEELKVFTPKSTFEGFAGGQSAPSAQKPATSKKVGRNDPCPCGSGKKYKMCCGK